ncbi:uncharacterized protein LOC122512734 [Leptopilina heterotoma]|uniref:uncharacterized protein LOC122512734 n=1 Tax=Leptopilina heterotoma TaxID=63436 RepID=UPI001CA874BA|nr:uncharacterized protein LOC122512734 [Leptopilina heterotoma]
MQYATMQGRNRTRRIEVGREPLFLLLRNIFSRQSLRPWSPWCVDFELSSITSIIYRHQLELDRVHSVDLSFTLSLMMLPRSLEHGGHEKIYKFKEGKLLFQQMGTIIRPYEENTLRSGLKEK